MEKSGKSITETRRDQIAFGRNQRFLIIRKTIRGTRSHSYFCQLNWREKGILIFPFMSILRPRDRGLDVSGKDQGVGSKSPSVTFPDLARKKNTGTIIEVLENKPENDALQRPLFAKLPM